MENKFHNEICPACKQIMPTMITEPGEYCVCFNCLEISIMRADHTLQIASESEMNTIHANIKRPKRPISKESLAFAKFATKLVVDQQFKGYSIGENAKGDKFILCFTCHSSSYNLNDIKNKYCGFCHKYHDLS